MSGVHRAGPLKQENKQHKHGKHKSNRALNSISKGKISAKVIIKKQKRDLKKQERLNKATQIRKKKREDVLAKKRQLGGVEAPPILVALIPLSLDADPEELFECIKNCDEEAVLSYKGTRCCHFSLPRFKTSFTFFVPPPGNVSAILDAAKVADVLLFVYSVNEDVSDYEELLLTLIFAQGLPASMHVLQGLSSIQPKKRNEVKQLKLKLIKERFPDEKLFCVEQASDALVLLHQLSVKKRKSNAYKDHHGYLLAEEMNFVENAQNPETGTLLISGYVRGKSMSANKLVHFPGIGSFQLLQIDVEREPHVLDLWKRKNSKSGGMDCQENSEKKVYEVSNPLLQQSLVSENVPDDMDGEQTWPTEADFDEAMANQKKFVKKVPKGTSEYQAAWIVDSEGEEGDEDDEDEDEESDEDYEDAQEMMEDMEAEDVSDEESVAPETEIDTMSVSEEASTNKYDEKMDMEEEKTMRVRFREERLDEMFPDEVDTPLDITARQRFARYRGLKSFATSPWDPKENLPLEYAKIFQFQNFKRTRKVVFSEPALGALAGLYATLHIKDFPKTQYEHLQTVNPVAVFGMLPHEQKMSVLNVVLKRHQSYNGTIKSKERLVFHIGHLKFSACPILSAHTNGEKHKYERFFHQDAVVVASIFAPIVFPPASVLCFKESAGKLELVATGFVLSSDPDRVVVKRTVLSGHPFKIHRRAAVVRYMFFNRDDIEWFKPVELRTKHGCKGHIKEPLGTHGHMKCIFDRQLPSQDTVMMNLYKRVFPKWTFQHHRTEGPIILNNEDNDTSYT